MEANELLELEYMAEERKRGLLLAAAVLVAGYEIAHSSYSFDECVDEAFDLYERVKQRLEER